MTAPAFETGVTVVAVAFTDAVEEDSVTLFVKLLPFAAVTNTTKVRVPLPVFAAIVPMFHVTVFPLTVPPPASETCTPEGSVSTSTALVAAAGPVFEKEMVYVSRPPGTAVVGHAVFET